MDNKLDELIRMLEELLETKRPVENGETRVSVDLEKLDMMEDFIVNYCEEE